MKVVGTGAPRMLTVRVKPAEVGVLLEEAHRRRDAVTQVVALAHTTSAVSGAGADDRAVEDRHDELYLLMKLLDELRAPVRPGQQRELVGPTWVLGPVIRGAASRAALRLSEAVTSFASDNGKMTPDELRARVDAVSSCTATLIGLDYAENHAVVT